MATAPAPDKQDLKLSVLLMPMPLRLLLPLAGMVLIVGAFYCSGYEKLLSGRDNWPASLIWAAYGLLPWLILFEAIKRYEWGSDRTLSVLTLAFLLVGTGLVSVAAEIINHALLLGRESAPVALQILRRTPGIGVMVLLLLLCRREQQIARHRFATGRESAASEADILFQRASEIRWIAAADNYVEVHLPERVLTRRLTMREADKMLSSRGFVRVHRSFIVNAAYVERLAPRSGSRDIMMKDGTTIPTGRAFGANLRRLC